MSMLPSYRLELTSDPSVPKTTPDFESCLQSFPSRPVSPASVAHPIVAVAAPPVEVIDPATSERKGGITHDRKRRPTHEWNSLDEFKTWRMKEQLDHGIELLLVRTLSASSSLWHEKRIYVCSRQGTGGKYKYIKKHPERIRSRPNKRTGCRSGVTVKTYPHTSTVLGWYRAEHDHATGILNLRFTRLQDSTRAYASSLLRRHMDPKEVLMRVRSEHGEHERGHYITMDDIYRIRKTIEQEGSVARPISSNQPGYERSEDSPAEVEELLYPKAEDVSEAGSSQVDVKPEVSDEQSNGCPDPRTPTPGPASHPVSSPGVTAGAESTPISVDGKTYHHLPAHLAAQAAALPPLIPPQRCRHHSHKTPVSAPTITFAPVISSPIHPGPASTPAVVPASQVTHNIAPPGPAPTPTVVPASQVTHNIAPPLPLSHDASVPCYMPRPLVIYIPRPPYQMTLYPLYQVYYRPPNV